MLTCQLVTESMMPNCKPCAHECSMAGVFRGPWELANAIGERHVLAMCLTCQSSDPG